MRSAGFEPAIPSLGSSYLNQAGLTSLAFTNNKFVYKIVIRKSRLDRNSLINCDHDGDARHQQNLKTDLNSNGR